MLLGRLDVCNAGLNRTRKLHTPASSHLTMHRKGSARGTVYQLAHACVMVSIHCHIHVKGSRVLGYA